MAGITTIEEALEFVQEVGVCTLFSAKVKGIPALWDAIDLPEDGGGRTKWGARVEAVWAWKNELPTLYPDDVYYGKLKGGHAALMSLDYLRLEHYPKWHRPVSECRELSRQVYDLVRLNSGTTAELRTEAMGRWACSKSRFESALKELQVTLNVVRLNEEGLKMDTWVPFTEVYGELVEELEADE